VAVGLQDSTWSLVLVTDDSGIGVAAHGLSNGDPPRHRGAGDRGRAFTLFLDLFVERFIAGFTMSAVKG
jgi:hypothetical protein